MKKYLLFLSLSTLTVLQTAEVRKESVQIGHESYDASGSYVIDMKHIQSYSQDDFSNMHHPHEPTDDRSQEIYRTLSISSIPTVASFQQISLGIPSIFFVNQNNVSITDQNNSEATQPREAENDLSACAAIGGATAATSCCITSCAVASCCVITILTAIMATTLSLISSSIPKIELPNLPALPPIPAIPHIPAVPHIPALPPIPPLPPIEWPAAAIVTVSNNFSRPLINVATTA